MKTPLSDFEENYVGYDVNSIMHYGEDAFTKNGKKTITFKDPEITLNTGQRLRPTTKGRFYLIVVIINSSHSKIREPVTGLGTQNQKSPGTRVSRDRKIRVSPGD